MAFEQARLDDIFREEFDRRKKKSFFAVLWQFLVCLALAFILYRIFNNAFFFLILFFPFVYFAPKTLYWLRTSFAAEFVCDITSYNEKGSKDLILQRIKDSIQPVINPPVVQNLTFISHSLGTVIASDFVREEEAFVSNFFTMGSPLPLFSLQFGGPDIFTNPPGIKDPQGRWVNIYDKGDPIAYPLKPLNEAYNRAVLKDREVKVGMFGVSHVKYWTHRKVHSIIARKLALDWLRLNNKLDKEKLDKLHADYDKLGFVKKIEISIILNSVTKNVTVKIWNLIRRLRCCCNFLVPFCVLAGIYIAWAGYKKIDILSTASQMYQLADSAVFNKFTGGSASNYKALIELFTKEIKKEPKLVKLFEAKLEETTKSYTNNFLYNDIVENTPICKSGSSNEACIKGATEKKGDLDYRNILGHIDYEEFWNSRVKATRLLRNITNAELKSYEGISWELILQKVIDRIKKDISLAVRFENAITYLHVVHPTKNKEGKESLKDSFDFEWVEKDWDSNKDKIINELKNRL